MNGGCKFPGTADMKQLDEFETMIAKYMLQVGRLFAFGVLQQYAAKLW